MGHTWSDPLYEHNGKPVYPGRAGDPDNNCYNCYIGRKTWWQGKRYYHLHENEVNIPIHQAPKANKVVTDFLMHVAPKLDEETVDYFTHVAFNIKVNKQEVIQAGNSLEQFFDNSGYEIKPEMATHLAKLIKVRIRTSLNRPKEVEIMIEFAKMGNFNDALEILDKYPAIVNYIPNNRAWGLIHQAAYFNNLEAVKTILKNPKCDPSLRTKQARDGIIKPSSTAYDIAKDENVKKVILEHQNIKREELKKRSMPTLVSVNSESEINVESILLMLNCFENVLCPKTLKSKKSLIYSNLMLEIFEFINKGDNFMRARREVSLQLQSIDLSDAQFLATGKGDGDIMADHLEDKRDFYSRVIRSYSMESSVDTVYDTHRFYSALNISLLTHGCNVSFVSGEDLALAAYGVLLNSILMYWTNMRPTNEPTYRGMNLKDDQLKKYKVGETFTWLSFNSSSLNKSTTQIFGNTLFICDNSHFNKYSAKGIRAYSSFPGEEEYLYPSGAKFRIDKVERNMGGSTLWVHLEDY